MSSLPKYAQAEIERRWQVDLETVGPLDAFSFRDIEDLYLPGTGLRLRKMLHPSGDVVFKFCKKYDAAAKLSRPVTNLYLSAEEYEVLSRLQGDLVRKRRYAVAGGALDVHVDGLALFEVEFESEAEALRYTPPGFVRQEVTHDASYSGAALASRSG